MSLVEAATSGSPLDLDEATLLAPVARPKGVPRTALVNRLRASRSYPVVTLQAPAGYGKTNLLAQWASGDDRPFAWVSISEGDDDPARICTYVASALSGVEPVDTAVFDALASRRRSATSAMRPLMLALSSLAQPLVLVLDNVHLLRSPESGDAVASLAEHVPEGSTLVLAGSALPRIPSARLRAAGSLFELGVDELALSRRECELLLRRLDVELAESEVTELLDRTEGWVTGVLLTALPLKENAGAKRGMLGEADRVLASYFDFEHLSDLSPNDVRFLTRTSVLDSLCGPLCDAVLESKGSARRLQSIQRRNLFLFSLEPSGRSYRYHHQFREILRAELERSEPELVPVLNRRAAAWCEANGAPETAISYAHAAGDFDLLARLVARRVLPAWSVGRDTEVETWLGWFDDESGPEKYPAIAVLGAWVHALRGRSADAERWLEVAVRSTVDAAQYDGSASIRPWIAVVRAALCRVGAEGMQSDAELALRDLGPASRWRPAALLLLGAAQLLQGENERAEATMADAAEVAASLRATSCRIAALAERSLLVATRGDEAGSEAMAVQARALVADHGLDGHVKSVIAFAASARYGLLAGKFEEVRRDLATARALRPQLTHALPWYSVQTSIELARVELTLLDVPGARAWLSHADEIARRRPDLGVLPGQVRDLEGEIDRVAQAQEERVSALTAAELRLLPFLATHLSFREIGEHLHVTRNTVKTQAISVYRKLGVSSRSKAIERAVELGLADAAPAVSADLIRTG
jgi:LuxR family maltose regulon positive regulatory protein